VIKEFKAFIMRGNAVDLAVGVVMGAAFGAVVSSLVKNVLTPITTFWQTCRPGERLPDGSCPTFSGLKFTVGHSTVGYGAVLNDIVSLVLIGAAVFFLVVRPLNALEERRKRSEPEPESPTRPCPECLSEIPREAKRCAHCTTVFGAAA
jgi:large conductance mechanosensitive channel